MIETSTHIDATPERVWSLVGDPVRTAEWSPEVRAVRWRRGVDRPAVGAVFTGHNQRGWRRWGTRNTISRYEPGSELTWEVTWSIFGVSTWGYRIDPDSTPGGCTLVETWHDRRGRLFSTVSPLVRGVRDTPSHNRRSMDDTLARIKAAAEGGS